MQLLIQLIIFIQTNTPVVTQPFINLSIYK